MQDPVINKPSIVNVVPAIAYEGISKLVLLQMQALHELGYPVKLIVLTTVDDTVLSEFAPSISRDKIMELHQPDAYLSVRALQSAFVVAMQLKHIIAREDKAMVFAHAPYAHFLLRLAMLIGLRKNKKIKLWQYFHALQYTVYPLNNWKRKLINGINKFMAQQFDDGHIFISKSVKKDVTSNLLNLKKQKIIYNALPLEEFVQPNKALVDPNVFTIVVPGRLDVTKGQLWFLDVFKSFVSLLDSKDKKVKLIIAGGGELQDPIDAKVKEYELDHLVGLTGHLDSSSLKVYIRDANLVLIPSLAEGFGLVVLEALGCGTTVLSSDAGGLKEIIEHGKNGFLFTAGDKEDCIEKLTFIFKNTDEALINSTEVINVLHAKFSFEKHIKKLVSVIEEG